ncbi:MULTISPECIES: DUF4276 family protein [unclassified Rhizobacter]|uniref:DUF4276 family protein n=1 Tax=unclassified Rhizobacter TaxID=2640088 RepID=UPI0006F9657F|nr:MULTISPECIES: DUF4276 family protein [unclassified Rhizobacter]KQU73663.1 hypothetical protein ASC88_28020 [Rhizobacter sp. Root29]KQW08929.1 hypothetical protein ASC98_24555 [Rhizobacter sp. Root1238]KRB21605.1 hypothetical protein ASE08_21785 [Rhizobacter sp. Root16D2]
MKRALIVVEGQTEERFVKTVLRQVLEPIGVDIRPTIVATKVVKDGANFKGGLRSFGQFREHLRRVLQGSGGALVTSMIDYYALPADFPGMVSRPLGGTPRQRVEHVERELRIAIGQQNFLPFIALHEYEAWLFSDSVTIPGVLTEPHKQGAFAAIADAMAPEDINEGPATAPSKRLQAMFPLYRKGLHGPLAAERIGIPAMRAKCPHFDGWLLQLEHYATA